MSDLSIEYGSGQCYAYSPPAYDLIKSSENGLRWDWKCNTSLAAIHSGKRLENCVDLSWTFSWDVKEMKEKGIQGFIGELTCFYYTKVDKQDVETPVRFDIELTHSGQCIRKRIGTLQEVVYDKDRCRFAMTLSLKSVKGSIIYNDYSMSSKFSDVILDVEGKKVNVNKNYLSLRSEFFDKLFNSDFKEKSSSEIPLKDVKYDDFVCFLDVIHPINPASPTDDDVEMLLELADRFMMPAVTNIVERYLLESSGVPYTKILQLADKWDLENLLERSLKLLVNRRHVEILIKAFNYQELSEKARLKLLDQLVTVVDATKQ